MKRIILISTVLLLFAVPTNAQVQYEIINLGAISGGDNRAYDINNSSQVVGYSGSQAFFWDNTNGMRGITSNAKAYGINNSGQVVGSRYHESPGFLWDGTNGMQALSFYAHDINDLGQVVGNTGGAYPHAVLWDEVNGGRDLNGIDNSPDYTFAHAFGINNSSQIVGKAYFNDSGAYHAYIWDDTNGIQKVASQNSVATDVNEQGQAVGYSYTSNNSNQAFLWDISNGSQPLGTLGGNYSVALGMNNVGQVVGNSSKTMNGDYHAFIWDSINGMQNLNDFLPEDSEWTLLTEANAVNNSGYIVGLGLINGSAQAFLMKPTVVPEPISSILFLTGGATLGFRRFWKKR